ncbi:MAG TPA: hypothetical protein VL329_07625 [Nitrospiraceae bacterium]|jgi:hypothetical protein|nr:hypothetical protein [Nitrospiraceae bacterium]
MSQLRRDEDIDLLVQTLMQAHKVKVQEAPHLSREWADEVMRDVRRQASREPSFSEVPHVIWRAAAIIAIVSTLFVGSVLTWTAGQGDADFSALLTMATADSAFSTLLPGEP